MGVGEGGRERDRERERYRASDSGSGGGWERERHRTRDSGSGGGREKDTEPEKVGVGEEECLHLLLHPSKCQEPSKLCHIEPGNQNRNSVLVSRVSVWDPIA